MRVPHFFLIIRAKQQLQAKVCKYFFVPLTSAMPECRPFKRVSKLYDYSNPCTSSQMVVSSQIKILTFEQFFCTYKFKLSENWNNFSDLYKKGFFVREISSDEF